MTENNPIQGGKKREGREGRDHLLEAEGLYLGKSDGLLWGYKSPKGRRGKPNDCR